jgi:hypothetical protein
MPYTCTNPDRTKTVVCLSDRVFVLGRDIPRDLLLDPKPLIHDKSKGGYSGFSAKNKDNFYGIPNQLPIVHNKPTTT